jgi:hypothetical protein
LHQHYRGGATPTVAVPRTWALSSDGGTDVNDQGRVGAAGLLLVATGLWAFAAPRSFFEVVATYPPFNEHLLHDIGRSTSAWEPRCF